VKFQSITIRNFQACKELTANFNDGITTISGRNGSGKTTILDAINFVLFGKDLENKKQFDVAFIDSNGNISTEPISVTLTVVRNDFTHTLTRSLVGSTCSCAIDGVPYKVGDYAAYVGQMTDGEERFKMYSNPQYFFNLQWKEQRDFLLSFFPAPENAVILTYLDVGDAFLEKLKGMTAEQIALLSKTKIKEIDKRQSELRGQTSLLEEFCNSDANYCEEYEAERESARKKLAAMSAETETFAAENSKIYSARQEVDSCKKSIAEIQSKAEARAVAEKASISYKVEVLTSDKGDLRDKLLDVVRLEGICPSCKRAYDKAQLDESARIAMDAEYDIRVQSSKIDEKIEKLKQELLLIKDTIFTIEETSRLETHKEQLADAEKISLLPIVDKHDIIEAKDKLQERIDELNRMLARKDLLDENKEKLLAVRKELRHCADERELYESLLLDAANFLSKRTDVVVAAINQKFATLRVKLFETLKNGEQSETFEITQNGIPYSALNAAAQLTLAIELVDFLKHSLGIESPMLIDNAERYTDVPFASFSGQVILAKAVAGAELTIGG